MSSEQNTVSYKRVGDTYCVTSLIRIKAGDRTSIGKRLNEMKASVGKALQAPPIMVHHYGTIFENQYDVEVCLPVKRGHRIDGYDAKTLPAQEVLSVLHSGPVERVKETYQAIRDYARERGLRGSEFGREVWHEYDEKNPDKNRIELQAVLANWQTIFAAKVRSVLGAKASDKVLHGLDELSLDTKRDERYNWTVNAVAELDKVATEEQSYEILSCCADRFPESRIEYMHSVYLKNKSVDDVLEHMQADRYWYAHPRREGNVIIETKLPVDEEGRAKAKTDAEKRKCSCHCSLIRDRLDGITPTYCNCGAGWYRQLWEGILGQSLKIETTKSVLKGDEVCQFAIHLPD